MLLWRGTKEGGPKHGVRAKHNRELLQDETPSHTSTHTQPCPPAQPQTTCCFLPATIVWQFGEGDIITVLSCATGVTGGCKEPWGPSGAAPTLEKWRVLGPRGPGTVGRCSLGHQYIRLLFRKIASSASGAQPSNHHLILTQYMLLVLFLAGDNPWPLFH